MSGRAGRRGKDVKGVIITMLDQKSDLPSFWDILSQQSLKSPLVS